MSTPYAATSALVEKARLFATAAHAAIGQKRKYSGADYIVHPAEVVSIISSVRHTPEMLAAEYCCNAMLAKREHNRTCHIFTAFWYLCAAKRAQELRSTGVNTWKSDEMATDAMKQMTDSALCAEYLARVAVAVAA